MSLRKLYYALPASWRFYARQVVHWPEHAIYSLFQSKDELVPPKRLIYTGRGDFLKTGLKFTGLAQEFAGLNPESHILDVGCGIGRIAIPLTSILSDKGSYFGFDIMKPGIDWCQQKIESKFPNFRFKWVDIRNELYRSAGQQSKNFQFPVVDQSKDIIFCISVFTHLTDKELEQYVKECHRVLKDRAFVITSFFVIDDHRKELQTKNYPFKFPYDRGHYFLMNEKLPAANVAYLKSHLEALFSKLGFSIIEYFPGHWKLRKGSIAKDFQDIYVLMKN